MKTEIEWIKGPIPFSYHKNEVMIVAILTESNSYMPRVQCGSALYYMRNPQDYSYWAEPPEIPGDV